MNEFKGEQLVGEIVKSRPCLAEVFEKLSIEYCCGNGKKTLDAVCREKSLSPAHVASMLQDAANEIAGPTEADLQAMPLGALVDHIVSQHHDYLRGALPRLGGFLEKVAAAHGNRDFRLHEVRELFAAMAAELTNHMWKEEQVLFPLVKRLESSREAFAFHCGSIANPIRQMELEHDDATRSLDQMQALTDRFTPPDSACNTYRVLLDGLAYLRQDMQRHVYKENEVLFPRALELEGRRSECTSLT
jgi:regulator of cell morphogenesis and NO signaling